MTDTMLLMIAGWRCSAGRQALASAMCGGARTFVLNRPISRLAIDMTRPEYHP